MNDLEHQRLRELLGSYALGHLPAAEEDRVRAHLDGCTACRAELADIAELVPLLDRVDPRSFASPASPPPDLGARIRAAVAAEPRGGGEESAPRRRRWLPLVAAAVLVVGVGGGVVAGRVSAPEGPPATTPVPLEPIELTAVRGGGMHVTSAGLVPHVWGVELRMEGDGFPEGAVFRAAFRDESGDLTPAGAFLGTGTSSMTCNLQAAVLRADVSEVVVMDARGHTVLRSAL